MKRDILVCGYIILIMNSCIVYHPQMTDIPLIKEKNELKIDGGVSFLPNAQVTVSYGLTDKIALQAFGNIGADDRYFFQGSTGLFKALNNRKVSEIYCGFGYGYGDAYNDANPRSLYGNYQLYFLQYNLGKIDCNFANSEYGLSIKSGYIHADLTNSNYYDNTYPLKIKYNHYLIEPNLFLKLGGEKFKVNLKIAGCYIFKFNSNNKKIPYSNLSFGLGINYKLF